MALIDASGQALGGSIEKEWKGAEFFGIEDAAGNTSQKAKIGALVIFRTKQFVEEAPTTVTEPVLLTAAGSWAFTEKK